MLSCRSLLFLAGSAALIAGCAELPAPSTPPDRAAAPAAAPPAPDPAAEAAARAEAAAEAEAREAEAAAEAAAREAAEREARIAWFARAWSEAGIDPADYASRSDGDIELPAIDMMGFDPSFLRQRVPYETAEPPGTIVIDSGTRLLHLVEEGGTALRYGIAVGREGFGWSGSGTIARQARWPRWTPPAEMIARDPKLAKWADGMPGGPSNPLGARALYINFGEQDSMYRIHGTNEPFSIGRAASSGCFRMLNQDVIDLHTRVRTGAKVVVL